MILMRHEVTVRYTPVVLQMHIFTIFTISNYIPEEKLFTAFPKFVCISDIVMLAFRYFDLYVKTKCYVCISI